MFDAFFNEIPESCIEALKALHCFNAGWRNSVIGRDQGKTDDGVLYRSCDVEFDRPINPREKEKIRKIMGSDALSIIFYCFAEGYLMRPASDWDIEGNEEKTWRLHFSWKVSRR